jgi:hypothetical protein
MADDEGVLGNLPKSRPGKRSAKRDSGRKSAAGRPAKAAEKAAVRAEAADTPAAKPPRTPRAARGGRTTAPKSRTDPAHAPSDPVSAAVRTAAGIAVTSVRVAGAVTQELLRRLPRP